MYLVRFAQIQRFRGASSAGARSRLFFSVLFTPHRPQLDKEYRVRETLNLQLPAKNIFGNNMKKELLEERY